jgi:hypothetical protein
MRQEHPSHCRVSDHPTVAAFHIFIFFLPGHPAIIFAAKSMPVSITMPGFLSKNFLTKID